MGVLPASLQRKRERWAGEVEGGVASGPVLGTLQPQLRKDWMAKGIYPERARDHRCRPAPSPEASQSPAPAQWRLRRVARSRFPSHGLPSSACALRPASRRPAKLATLASLSCRPMWEKRARV